MSVAEPLLTPTLPPNNGRHKAELNVGSAWQGIVLPLAPPLAAAAALAAHWFLPSAEVSTHLYAYTLLLLLAIAVPFSAVTLLWRRATPWGCDYGPLFAGVIGLLCAWDLATLKWQLLPLPYFPCPDHVLEAMREDIAVLLESTWYSLQLLLAGYVVGVAAGMASGLLMGWFRRARYWGMPLLRFFGPIPATAFVPLAMVIFDTPFVSGLSLIALAVWFPVTMLTTSGIANVPASYFDVARTLGASRLYLIFRVAVPAALPNIFVGLFMGLGAAFLTLVVAETVGVKAGLGWYLKWQQGYLEYAKVYGALVIMSIFFSGTMTALFRLRDWLLVWQKGVIRW